MIGLKNDNYLYEEVIGKEYKIKKSKYTITGIIRSKKESIMNETSGIIYDKSNFINNIPDEIYLYPKDYDNKLVLLNNLDKYSDIKYTDLSTSFKEVSTTLMNSITIILISFSIITLIVSSIMIGILTYINIMEYKKEIGIYKSLGMSNKEIKDIFYYENLLIVIKSVMLSTLFILIIRLPLNNLIYNLTGLSTVIAKDISIYLRLLEVGLIMSGIASIIPTRYISKFKVVDILRNE
jgi:putative ABC transport system permease protein